MKNKIDDSTKQFLLQKYYDEWLKENSTLVEDIEELAGRVVMFNFKWGIDFVLVPLKSHGSSKERMSPLVEKLFETQEHITQSSD